MWHVLETAWELLDLLVNWRIYVCTVLAVGIALVVSWLFPGLAGGTLYFAAVVIGAVIGVTWEWRST